MPQTLRSQRLPDEQPGEENRLKLELRLLLDHTKLQTVSPRALATISEREEVPSQCDPVVLEDTVLREIQIATIQLEQQYLLIKRRNYEFELEAICAASRHSGPLHGFIAKYIDGLFHFVRRLIDTSISILAATYAGILVTSRKGSVLAPNGMTTIRNRVKLRQMQLAMHLIERLLDVFGVDKAVREPARIIVYETVVDAALQTNMLHDQGGEEIGNRADTNRSNGRSDRFPVLGDEEVQAIIRRGQKRPWGGKGCGIPPFEWVQRTYGEWIPGLMQNHLLAADKALYFAFQKQVERNGLPDWLDVPSKKDARLRMYPDNVKQIEAIRSAGRTAQRLLRTLES